MRPSLSASTKKCCSALATSYSTKLWLPAYLKALSNSSRTAGVSFDVSTWPETVRVIGGAGLVCPNAITSNASVAVMTAINRFIIKNLTLIVIDALLGFQLLQLLARCQILRSEERRVGKACRAR